MNPMTLLREVRTAVTMLAAPEKAHAFAYTKTPYLTRVEWDDGTLAYCRRCDAKVPLRAAESVLVCPDNHRQHPLNVITSLGLS